MGLLARAELDAHPSNGCTMARKSSRRSVHQFQAVKLRLEVLEDRLAPAKLVDAMDVTYLDAAGNQVAIHTSLPLFNSATVNSVLLFDKGSVNGDNSTPQQLQKIDLAQLGTAAEGTNLSVVPQNAPTDLSDVGFINAGGIDLGTMRIQGDLGGISAGSGSSKVSAVASLTVQSMGAHGTATQAAGGNLSSAISGKLQQLIVIGSFVNEDLSAGQIGSLYIGGSLIGTTDNTGQISATGGIGGVTIGGDLQGGSGKNSGQITTPASIDHVSIGHSVIGGSGNGSAEIFATRSLGNVSMGGSLIGGTGQGSGYIEGHASLGQVNITGDVNGSTGAPYSAEIKSEYGSIAGLNVGGYFGGFVLANNGGNIGVVSIGGNIVGGASDGSGLVWSNGGSITSVTVGGAILGGGGKNSGQVSAGGSIGPVKIGHGIVGSSGIGSGGIFAGKSLGNVTLGGSLVGGLGGGSGSIQGVSSIGQVNITGDVNGSSGTPYSALIKSEYGTIAGLSVTGSFSGTILANHGGNIGVVSIGGSIIGGSPNTGFPMGLVWSPAGSITQVTVGGAILGGGGMNSGGISAGTDIGPVKVGHGVIGGKGGGSGQIYAGHYLSSVTLGGSLVGGLGSGSGRIEGHQGLGQVNITGDVNGSTGTPYSGQIKSEYGNIAAVAISGSLSGLIFTNHGGSLGPVKIGGSIVGGSADDTGFVFSTGSISSVIVGGDVVGGSGLDAGEIQAGTGGIGPVTIGGSVRGGKGNFSGSLRSYGSIGNVTLGSASQKGLLLGGSGANSGIISAGGSLGFVTVFGDLRGGSVASSGTITAESGLLAGVRINGSLIGTFSNTGVIFSGGDLGPVTITLDLVGGKTSGTTSLDSSGYIEGAHVASVSIGGSLLSGTNTGTGTLTRDGSIRARNDLGPVVVTGDIVGNAANPVVISAEGQANPTAFVDIAIRSLSVGGSVTYASILGGYDPSENGVNGEAQIGSVSVGGFWVASNLATGVLPGPDGLLGTADDTEISGGTDQLASSIASIVIGKQVLGAPGSGNTMVHFGFVAEWIKSLEVNGVQIALHSGPQNDDLAVGTSGEVTLLEVTS
jgi:hypothetical protein